MAATIIIVCPYCKKKTRVAAQFAGKRGKCPNPECQKLIDINPSSQDSIRSMDLLEKKASRGMDSGGFLNSTWFAAAIGAAATVVLYALIFYPLSRTYIGTLMTDRGPVQHTITLVTCWGLAILAMRYWAVQRELRVTGMELQLIPLEIGMQITPTNVDQFLGHLNELAPAEQDSVLTRRLRGALEHFKSRNNVSEVQTYLSSQAQLDSSAVDSGYTLIRVFIWLCPILGFIGTVTGISDAVTGLAQALPKAEAVAPVEPGSTGAEKSKEGGGLAGKMLKGMETVTAGLAVAFDTTFLGLVAVCILMFPFEGLKKVEYSMLDRVEDFTNESLVRRMSEENAASQNNEMPELVRTSLESAFREHQRWLGEWQAQVKQLGQLIGADFEAAAGRVVEQVGKSDSTRSQEIQRASRAVDELFQKVTTSVPSSDVLNALQKLSSSMNTHNTLMKELVAQSKEVSHLESTVTHDHPDASYSTIPPLKDGSSHPQKKTGIFRRLFGG